jgi:hypothetical protein
MGLRNGSEHLEQVEAYDRFDGRRKLVHNSADERRLRSKSRGYRHGGAAHFEIRVQQVLEGVRWRFGEAAQEGVEVNGLDDLVLDPCSLVL